MDNLSNRPPHWSAEFEHCNTLFSSRARKQGELDSFFQELLLKFVRPAATIHDRRSFAAVFHGNGPGMLGATLWDTTFGIRMYHDRMDIACIGFEPSGRSLVIKQIQGSIGTDFLLKLMSWERLLVTLVRDLALDTQYYEELVILPASKSKWLNPKGCKGERLKKHQERLKLHYDVTARRLKFKLDEQSGNYILRLKSG